MSVLWMCSVGLHGLMVAHLSSKQKVAMILGHNYHTIKTDNFVLHERTYATEILTLMRQILIA